MTLPQASIARPDLPLEEVPCYLCGSEKAEVLVDDPPFQVKLCEECGLGYTSPRIQGDRIHEIYDASYWASPSAKDFGYTEYSADVEGYLRTFRRRAEVLSRHKEPGRLLELGCAAGYFLSVMRDLGWEVHGLELSEDILAEAKERFSLENVHSVRLEALDYPPETFDAIAMWDVVEHMADPVPELERCHTLLRDDGVLVLQTQDIGSRFRKVLGSRWHHFKQLEHIYHFSPTTIRTLLQRAGFEVVELTRKGAGKYVSFNFLAERAHRLGKVAGALFSPCRLIGRRFLYVNPLDEFIVVAKKAAPSS